MPHTTFTFRLDDGLKAAFAETARAEDRTAAQLLRVLMREAVGRRGPVRPAPERPAAATPPDRDAIVNLLRAHESEIRARGVTRLALVGSVARGDATAASDVDVLADIDPKRKFSLIDRSGLRLYFHDLLGRETDVLVRGGLGPKLRQRLGRDELPVF